MFKKLLSWGSVLVSGIATVLEQAPEILEAVAPVVNKGTFIGKYGLLIAGIIKGIQTKKKYEAGEASGLSEKLLDKIPDAIVKNGKKL